MNNEFRHQPVLLNEVTSAFDYIKKLKSAVFVDGTIGLGGHSLVLAKQYSRNKIPSFAPPNRRATEGGQETNNIQIVGIDKDQKALDTINSSLISNFSELTLVHDDFKNIKEILRKQKIEKIDGMLLDLGVSSMQLDDKNRGFSFSDMDSPLDMRMDQDQILTAANIVNNYPEKDLEEVLKNGEEWDLRKITRIILEKRKEKIIERVGDLVEIISKVKHPTWSKSGQNSKTNPATGTFRALRLEVNRELVGLDQAIGDIVDLMNPGGKLAIITFHSLEDRIVKNKFRELENPCTCPKDFPYCVCNKMPQIKIITKKPITPSEEEIRSNPRSRSAKLRVAEKI